MRPSLNAPRLRSRNSHWPDFFRTCLLLAVFACVAGGMLPASAVAQVESKEAEVISLQFDWPVGLVARVGSTHYKKKQTAAGPDSTRLDVSYRMSILPHPEGRLVRYDDMRFPAAEGSAGPALELVRSQLAERLGFLTPSFVVSAGGEFLGVEDLETIKAQLDTLLLGMLGSRLDELPAGARQLIESLTSREMLAASAAQEWGALVATWVEAELEIGAVYELEAEEPIPFLGGFTVPTVYQFLLVGRVPCEENATDEGCVELQMVSFPDPDVFGQMLERVVDQLAEVPEAEMPAFEDLEIETSVTLVAEPATLIPHSLEIVKRIEGALSEKGEREHFGQLEVKSYRYSYQN